MNVTLIVLITYLVFMFLIALYFSRKESLEAYFLNKKKTSLWLMTFSNVATVVGAGATVAIVAEVYNTGISYGLILPVSFVIGMIIMGIVSTKIKKAGDKYKAYSIVDFFHKRFDTKNKSLLVVTQLFLLIIWIGIQAIAFASLASVLVGLEYRIALFLAAAVTIIYTSIGGLKIDIITDFVQFWIIMIVFIIMTFFGYSAVGGINNLLSNLPRGHLDPLAFGGVSWLAGAVIMSGFIYVGNTGHWQRIFSTKNQQVARKAFFLSIPFIVILSIFVLLFGLEAVVLLPGLGKETAMFSFMDAVLPNKLLVGLGFASILAVIMSSIDTLLIGGSTILYKIIFKEQKKKVIIARLITGLFGILGFLLAFLVPNIVILSLLVTYLALIFVPPILGGFYSKKFSANASFYSILIPTILLFVLFPIMEKQTFIITSPIGILIAIFYDKIFKKHSENYA
ncbi:sodium:solute symporter family protein [Candidatus Woesearchaeota archaeon]|nr:sodium:solute symporter family protein [Candidatus Woesearchaeota archaeon]